MFHHTSRKTSRWVVEAPDTLRVSGASSSRPASRKLQCLISVSDFKRLVPNKILNVLVSETWISVIGSHLGLEGLVHIPRDFAESNIYGLFYLWSIHWSMNQSIHPPIHQSIHRSINSSLFQPYLTAMDGSYYSSIWVLAVLVQFSSIQNAGSSLVCSVRFNSHLQATELNKRYTMRSKKNSLCTQNINAIRHSFQPTILPHDLRRWLTKRTRELQWRLLLPLPLLLAVHNVV